MFIADAHNDCLTNLSNNKLKSYLRFCKNNQVVNLFTAYYVAENQTKNIELVTDIENKANEISKYKFCVFTIENLGFINNLAQLDQVISLNPFACTLTWNHNNQFAGGAYDDGEITSMGKIYVKILENHNILIDIAHLNEKSTSQLIELTALPIFCSHTACKSVYNISRNISRETLQAINKTNGYVGLCLYNSLLTNGEANFDIIYYHLDQMLEFAGIKNVGLGTDFNGTGKQNPLGINYDYDGFNELYSYLSKYYNKNILDKIFYKNLLDFKIRMNNLKTSR